MTKISIIIPVYNSEKYLKKCLDSILNQTYKDFEVLVINDGSKDQSWKVMEEYQQKDKRILIYNQENMGVAKTRNKGIQLAKGEYVTFVDNDDYLKNDYLEQFVNASLENDIVIGGYERVDTKGNVLHEFQLKNTYWAKYTFITPWARIFKRSYLLENHIEFLSSPIGEDIYFNLQAYKSDKIKVIPYNGYCWLYNEESVSNTVHKGFNEKVDISKFLDLIYPLKNKENEEYFIYYYYRFGIWYLMYSGREATKYKFMEEYQKIKKWNQENKVKMNIFPFSSKLKGEKLSLRLYVLIFHWLDKLHFMKLFASIYCKGK